MSSHDPSALHQAPRLSPLAKLAYYNPVGDISPPTGEIHSRVSLHESGPSNQSHPPTIISGAVCVASYNWMDGENATIAIPGGPPAWTPPASAPRLRQDNGEYFRDQNAARFPEYPMEPAVRAVIEEMDSEGMPVVDIFACSSTMRNLLGCVRSSDKPFRFLVDSVGNTVFFIRRENSPTQLIPVNGMGYGHTFPDAYTTWPEEISHSQSHQRIVNYSLTGLNVFLRYEADGYIDTQPSDSNPTKPASVEPDLTHVEDDPTHDDDDPARYKRRSNTSSIDSNDLVPPDSLIIQHLGQHIPQSKVFDLKTRSIAKANKDIIGEEMPRLWITQVPKFIIAYHKSGHFGEAGIMEDIEQRRARWEQDEQANLGVFAALLKRIVKVAREWQGDPLEVRYRGFGDVELRFQHEFKTGALSDKVKVQWAELQKAARFLEEFELDLP